MQSRSKNQFAAMREHKWTRICCLGVVVVAMQDTRAETFPLNSAVPHSVPEPLRPKLQELAQQHADRLYSELLLRTDEAHRVCDLSDTQLARLELAEKGAVQHVIDDWLATIAVAYASEPEGAAAQLLTMRIQGQVRSTGVVLFGGADVRQDMIRRNLIVAENGRVVEFRQGVPQLRGQVVIMPGKAEQKLRGGRGAQGRSQDPPSLNLELSAVTDAGIWRATLDRQLTETQRSELDTLRVKRALIRDNDDTQVGRMVSYLDDQLLLDSGQCQRITELCARFTLVHKIRVDDPTAARMALEELPREVLAELLSDRQQARLREIHKESKGPFDAFRTEPTSKTGTEAGKGGTR